jgi:hypothetical protein
MSNNTKQQTHRELTEYIILLASKRNPYNRQGANTKIEYLTYNMGYMASYLASLCEQDPYILKRYKSHCEEQSKLE